DSTKITKTNLENETCLKILFLGDSYSSKPFSKKSYGDFFSEKLSDTLNYCVESIYLSSGGVGTSQQLAILEDKIDSINPDIVFWQFYWNDFLDNIKFSVHDMKNDSIIRKKAWDNSAFWAGYLNQKIPFLIDSTLGFYLSNKLINKDILRSWPINPFEGEELYDYNKKFISLAIKNVEKISQKKEFSLFTTVSPLECLIVNDINCEDWTIKQHQTLESILMENSSYISMTKYYKDDDQAVWDTSDKNSLFSDLDPAYKGIRHLSDSGEEYFGNILFENFKSQTLENN
ncbi:MAG: SGNH/GDSL hydrolase family protein, partial [Candidatus Pacebacteria bacterium]|nr:SGNH/GDSL hydrolase family protein [Candidatus Paceibacterota bacterium]